MDDALEGLKIRCAELHTCSPGATLRDPKHFDSGSVVTIDIRLRGDFEGGDFTTLETDDTLLRAATFEVGDALVFPSYKYHSVGEVTTGVRRVLVCEFWRGEERECNQRSMTAYGDEPLMALLEPFHDR